jgi:hypothetical protein
MRNAYKILNRTPKGKNPPRRIWRRSVGNMKMFVKEESEDKGWIELAQDRVQWWAVLNTAINILVLHKTGNFLTG